ncbi:MAG TPA: hypothetical protein VF777_04370 [Phycisphaerales bacterium]
MNDSNSTTEGVSNILVLRVVCFALCLGVAVFGAVAIMLTNEQSSPAFENKALTQQATDLGRMLTPAVFVLGFTMLAAWPFVRRAHHATGRRVWQSSDPVEVKERKLFNGYSVLSILRAALAEGFGLFGVVTFFLTAQWITLAAPAIAIALIVATMPSQARYERFLASVTK